MYKRKYLLCRPRGGLVDNLARIANCFEYALQTNRTLVIDTQQAVGFNDAFDNYFERREDTSDVEILTLTESLLQQLNKAYVYPHELNLDEKGRMIREKYPFLYRFFHRQIASIHRNKSPLTYVQKYVFENKIGKFVCIKTKTPLAFDMKKKYSAEVLLHHSDGTFRNGFNKLYPLAKYLCFTPILSEKIKKAIAPYATSPYHAIHVRHTDYQSQYKQYFKEIKEQVTGKRLLICSDSTEVIEFAKTYFISSEVFTTDSYTSPTASPIHNHKITIAKKTGKSMFDLNAEAYIDLYALSGAEVLLVAPVVRQNNTLSPSGYSRMAVFLHKNQELRDSFLHK